MCKIPSWGIPVSTTTVYCTAPWSCRAVRVCDKEKDAIFFSGALPLLRSCDRLTFQEILLCLQKTAQGAPANSIVGPKSVPGSNPILLQTKITLQNECGKQHNRCISMLRSLQWLPRLRDFAAEKISASNLDAVPITSSVDILQQIAYITQRGLRCRHWSVSRVSLFAFDGSLLGFVCA